MTFGELIKTFEDRGGTIFEIFPPNAKYKITVGYNFIDMEDETFIEFVKVFNYKPIASWSMDMTEIDGTAYPRITIHLGNM